MIFQCFEMFRLVCLDLTNQHLCDHCHKSHEELLEFKASAKSLDLFQIVEGSGLYSRVDQNISPFSGTSTCKTRGFIFHKFN